MFLCRFIFVSFHVFVLGFVCISWLTMKDSLSFFLEFSLIAMLFKFYFNEKRMLLFCY